MDSELRELQLIEIDLLKKVVDICKKYNIQFFLHYGSLLGAVRHKGFIPWDDDIDIVMPRADFDLFLRVAEEELDEPYYLQTGKNSPELICNGKAMLRRSDTMKVIWGRDVLKPGNQGVFIDIMVLDKIPCESVQSKKQRKKVDWYLSLLFIKANRDEVTQMKSMGIGKKGVKLRKLLVRFLSYRYLNRKLKQFMSQANSLEDGYEYCCFPTDLGGAYRHKTYSKECFEEMCLQPYEDMELPIPVGYHEVLTKLYGDNYMELPPESKRKSKHCGICKTDIPYDIYLKHFTETYKYANDRDIYLFGAGHMVNYYLEHEGKKYKHIYTVDNNSKLWGDEVKGIPIKSPEELRTVDWKKSQIIICSIYYREIEKQLLDMGITNYYVYIQNKNWL